MRTKSLLTLVLGSMIVLLLAVAGASAQGGLTRSRKNWARHLFFDKNLSLNT